MTEEQQQPKNENYYAKLAKINVSEFVEHKGQFKYLSWTWAIDQLRRFDPTATWEVKRFGERKEMPKRFTSHVAVGSKRRSWSIAHVQDRYLNWPLCSTNSDTLIFASFA